MRILFIGDIVGRPGRDIVFTYLDSIKKEYNIDFTIINGENSAHGKGITSKIYDQFINAGVDCITMGNHSFSKSEIIDHLDELDKLVVPHNHIKGYGNSAKLFDVSGFKLCVCNILGEVFMSEVSSSPFESMEEIMKEHGDVAYLVDLHAEATSEKLLFAHYFKDRVLATLGTHTHVQTADERLIGNEAYISDVGMCGVFDSIIGRDIDEMIDNHIYGNATRFTVADGDAQLCAVVIDVDTVNKRATSISRIQIRPSEEALYDK